MKQLFSTTVIGSLPRPKWLLDAFVFNEEGELSSKELEKIVRKAVPYAVALQESAGVDIITDGEWGRIGYFEFLAQKLQGFERSDFDKKEKGKRGNVRKLSRWTQKEFKQALVTKKIKYSPLAIEEAKFLKENTKKKIKVTFPSPYLVVNRLWHPEFSTGAYSSREEFLDDLVPIYQKEVMKLKKLGVFMVQFDDPWLCFFVDKNHRKSFGNIEREISFAIDSLNKVLDGISGIKTVLHLCRGNRKRQRYATGAYEPIIDYLYQAKVNQLALEFSGDFAGEVKIFKNHPTKKEIGLGVLDVRGRKIPEAKDLVKQVKKILKYLKPSQIYLNPDCGFAPTSTNPIPIDEPYLKLSQMVKAAEILRKSYS